MLDGAVLISDQKRLFDDPEFDQDIGRGASETGYKILCDLQIAVCTGRGTLQSQEKL